MPGIHAEAQCFVQTLEDPPPGLARNQGQHEIIFDGEYLYEGAPWDGSPLGGRGIVRIYERDGDDWNILWKLPPPDRKSSRTFGYAIEPIGPGPHILVGDPEESVVWELRVEEGAWQVVREIRPPDEGVRGFGNAIDFEGELLAIGAPYSDIVYLYRYETDNWVLERRAEPHPDRDINSYGFALDLKGNKLLVGARNGDAAELWVRGGFGWTRSATLHHPDPDEALLFGRAVLLHEELAIVTDADTGRVGSVYVYRNQGGGQGWILDQVLKPWDTDDNDWSVFGWDIASQADILYIQAQHGTDFSRGATYLFREIENMGWQPYTKITPQAQGHHLDFSNIAVQGDLLAIAGMNSYEGLAPVELFSLRPRCLCIADFNEDGRINPSDVTAFLNAWNARDPAADANADGLINTQDVAWFLLEWNTREHCIS